MVRMKRIVCRWRAIGSFVTVLTIVCTSAHDAASRQPQRVDLSIVAGGRPLAAAIRELEDRFGWVVTYEDPPYEWAVDIEDVTLAVSKSPNATNRVLVPRTRSFAFRYPDTDDPRPSAVLSAMLRDHNLGGYGEFRLIGSGSAFHVVPSMSANERGIPTARRSRLDVAVTLDDRERTAQELIEAVIAQVRVATGIHVVVGTTPISLLMQTKLRSSAKDESARDVLLRALAATGNKLSWQLFCDPGATKMCIQRSLRCECEGRFAAGASQIGALRRLRTCEPAINLRT